MGTVLSESQLADAVAADRAAGRTVALANGCFDLLHVGHVRYLQASAGEADPRLDAITSELAEVYEAKAQLQKFADTLTAGCGPHCGTEEGGGCTSGGCSTCAVVGACKTH